MSATPTMRGQGLRRAGALGAAVGCAALLAGARDRRLGSAVEIGGLALAWSSVRPSNPLLGPVAHAGPRGRAEVALVIAGAPGPDTAAILDALADADAHATFFVVGSRARRQPGPVRQIHAAGHALANGGFAADPVALAGPPRLAGDLRRTEEAVAEAVGADVLRRLFMAPQGVRGPATWAGARRGGYRLVAWSRAVWPDGVRDERAAARIAVGGLEPGAIIAIGPSGPDRPAAAAAAVRAVCAQAGARGLALVGFEDLTAHAPDGLTSRVPAAEERIGCR